jgi:hypothetical protein
MLLHPLVYLAENPLEATRERIDAAEHGLIHFIQNLIERCDLSDE